MREFLEVHKHISPEGRSREVNTGKGLVEKPPTPPSVQLIRKTFSASACASKGSLEVEK